MAQRRAPLLRSATGRRVFYALLAAAVLPVLLWAALGYGVLSERMEAQAREADRAWLKQVALRAFDRLVAARAALATHAATAPWEQPLIGEPRARELLHAVATVAPGGLLVAGDGSLAQDWQAATSAATGLAPVQLAWRAAPGGLARVLLSHADPQGRGHWLAEVDAVYLWSDFGADGLGADVCVFDAGGQPVRCPSAAPPPAGDGWTLFLAATFGAGDWRFAGTPRPGGPWEQMPLGRWMLLGSLGSLLLVSALGLVLVRRLMGPLDELADGTRRLAAHDWSARVPARGQDEFAALARSFNTMAERVGHQVQALKAHAEIDRSILEGRPLADVLARLAAQLQALTPGATVAVAVPAEGAGWCAYRTGAGAAPVVLAAPPAALLAREGLRLEFGAASGTDSCRWATAACGTTAEGGRWIAVLPACWHGETVALVVAVAEAPLMLDAERHADLAELRDRVVLTLAWTLRERSLVERAVRDGLTGLLNRNGLHDACEALLAAGEPFTALQLDLDGFKDVNDSFGHAVGDELLQQVAARLEDLMPPRAKLARPGGDEFVVLLPGPLHEAQALAGLLCARLRGPFAHALRPLHVGASIGVAAFPVHAEDRTELLRRADLAMYAAKQAGRGRWRAYERALDDQAAERAWIVDELRNALDRDELSLHFQPRLGSRGRTLHSAEALLRWHHPVRGAIGPQRFVPLAEQAGLVGRIGAWVLDEALRQLAAWRAQGVVLPRVSVNVSARQLDDDQFADQVLVAIERHGLQPHDLEIEITESLFVGDVDAVAARLLPLRERGVLVALDDFGTGYSSLSALHRLPVDVLKIDRSFVVELGDRESADAVARTIVALARALGKTVVAEGVETPVQEAHLLALGCDELQGYLYAPALPPPAFVAFAARAAQAALVALAAPASPAVPPRATSVTG